MQRSRVRSAVAGGIAAIAIGGFAVANAANDVPSQGSSEASRQETSATGQLPDGSTRNYVAGTAGSVEVTRDGDSISVTRTLPNLGWVVEVERGSGDEVEVEFTNGGREIDFNAELEDGQIRVRVTEDDVTIGTGPGSSTPGTAPDDTSPNTTPDSTPTTAPDDFDDDDFDDDDGIDNSGPGSDDSGHDDDDDHDDDSGPGSDDSGHDDGGDDD